MTIDLTMINKPFGELDRETKGALLLAAHEGEEIEYSGDGDGDSWTTVNRPGWRSKIIYRVKPAPLTKDTVDWSQVAEGWDWMARDENGRAYFFRGKPTRDGPIWVDSGHGAASVIVSSYVRGTCDWKDSLLTRPGKE